MRRPAKAPSQRQLRVGEELRHTLAMFIERGELHDPALEGVAITITEVRVSPDLRKATAFIVPLGGGEVDNILEGLRRARPFLRKHVARTVQLRSVPELSFLYDESFDEAQRMDDLFHQPRVARDLKKNAPVNDAETGDAEGGTEGGNGS